MQQSTSCLLTDRQGQDRSGQNEVTESDQNPLAKCGHQHADWLWLHVTQGHAWETKGRKVLSSMKYLSVVSLQCLKTKRILTLAGERTITSTLPQQ